MLEKGKVHYDDRGYPRCHVCGKSFKKVLTHVWQKHGMSADEYKEHYGLDAGKGIICDDTRAKLRAAVSRNYDKVVVENLLNKNEATQFKPGSGGRTRDKVRLQTKLVLVNNIIKK